jgi:hypothetical protein
MPVQSNRCACRPAIGLRGVLRQHTRSTRDGGDDDEGHIYAAPHWHHQ